MKQHVRFIDPTFHEGHFKVWAWRQGHDEGSVLGEFLLFLRGDWAWVPVFKLAPKAGNFA